MAKPEPDKAELDFFNAIATDGPLTKEAIALEEETAEALGIKTVSPRILTELEQNAATLSSQAPDPGVEAPEAEPEVELETETAPESTPPPEDEVYEPAPIEYLQEAEPPSLEGLDLDAFDREDPEPETPPAVEPELPSRASHGKLFNDKRAHPLQILHVLTMRYKTAWPTWEPDTLWWSLRRDFGPIGELTRNKIQAISLAVSTDVPWLDWDVFENCGLAWNDVTPIFGAWQPMTPMQVAFAVHILQEIRDDEPFAHEVNAYIAAVLEEHGWVYAPEEWFAGAQEIIDRKKWLVGFKVEVENGWDRIREIDPETIEWQDGDALGIHLLKLAVVQRYLQGREVLRQVVPGVPGSATTSASPVP